MRAARAALGILRHRCARLAVSVGANVEALQRMLGHASAKETLDTYSDLFDADSDSVAAALNQVIIKMNVGKMWVSDGVPTTAAIADMA